MREKKMRSGRRFKGAIRASVWALVSLAVVAAISLECHYLAFTDDVIQVTSSSPPSSPPPSFSPPGFMLPNMRGVWPGIKTPATVAAKDVSIDDDLVVIGIRADGMARAYLLAAMAPGPTGPGPTLHVVNDLIGRHAISVTYCSLTGCSRVFVGDEPGVPLEIDLGGLENGGMVLRINNVEYSHLTKVKLGTQSGPGIPFAEWPYERTTWKQWRQAHAETDVYLGDSRSSQLNH
jgi:hypothetical protein